jgi:hypothetical protein
LTPAPSRDTGAEKAGVAAGVVASLLIPEGEGAKGAEILTRFGSYEESAARLAKKAAEAEASNLGIHGCICNCSPC